MKKKKRSLRFIFVSPVKSRNFLFLFYTLVSVGIVVLFLVVPKVTASAPTPLSGPEATATAQTVHAMATAQAVQAAATAQAQSTIQAVMHNTGVPQKTLLFAGGLLLGLFLGGGSVLAYRRPQKGGEV